MNIRLERIVDKNDKEERLVIKVLVDTDIGRYGIFKTGKTPTGGINNRVHNTYWFPDKLVKAGDLVILYTKGGIESEKKNSDGSTSHFYYWGHSSPLWEGNTFGTVLVSISEWQTLG